MQTAKYDFMGKRRIFFGISAAIIAVIVLCSIIFGVQMDIQFRGGAMLTLGYEGEIQLSDVEEVAKEVLGSDITVQSSDSATGQKAITVSMPGSETMSADELEDLIAQLNEAYEANNFTQLETSNVDATMGREFFIKCLVAVVTACVLILIYVWIRFRRIGGLTAGTFAVCALINDLIVVFGCFVILQIPLNGNFVAAMLTILGYSINDTVVIYDRIRENRKLMGNKLPFEQLVNLSINQSLRRSVNTTVTTCIALAVVCVVSVVFSLSSIFTFALPLMIGMASGLYTSLFLATGLWVEWEAHRAKKASK